MGRDLIIMTLMIVVVVVWFSCLKKYVKLDLILK